MLYVSSDITCGEIGIKVNYVSPDFTCGEAGDLESTYILYSKLIWQTCPASREVGKKQLGDINARVGRGPSSRGLNPLLEAHAR